MITQVLSPLKNSIAGGSREASEHLRCDQLTQWYTYAQLRGRVRGASLSLPPSAVAAGQRVQLKTPGQPVLDSQVESKESLEKG